MTPLASAAPAQRRILVVDDDRLVLATVTHGLSEAGYEVIDADNGDDAILLAREHRPQLALLDIRMEGKSGFDVAEVLRAYGIPFVFLSAFSDEATLATVRMLGALDYLVKPLEVGQIIPAVEAAFARLGSPDAELPAGTALPASPTAPTQRLPAASPSAEAGEEGGPLAQTVALAVGVLMHRHSLPREEALRRLQRLADDQRQPLLAQADRVLAALEELART